MRRRELLTTFGGQFSLSLRGATCKMDRLSAWRPNRSCFMTRSQMFQNSKSERAARERERDESASEEAKLVIMGQKRGLFSLGWDHLFKSSAPSFSMYLSKSARSEFQDYARPSTIVISQSSNFYGPPFPNIPRVGSGGKKSHSSQDRLSARKINVWVPNSPSSFTIKKGWRPQTSSRERKSVLFGTLKRWSVGVNEAKINRNAENGLFKCFFTPTCHFYCFFSLPWDDGRCEMLHYNGQKSSKWKRDGPQGRKGRENWTSKECQKDLYHAPGSL